MGDFSMSQEQIEKTQRKIKEAQQREEQKNYQRMILRTGLSSDVRESEWPTATEERKAEVRCENGVWKQICEKAGMVKLVAPEGVAIGSPIQQEPAEDKKTKKEREKKLAKIKKKGCGNASHQSVVLQERVSQNIAFRSDMAKQRKQDREKGIDEILKQNKDNQMFEWEKEANKLELSLQKEDAKQNLIRAFSHNIRTDRFGKPIKEDEEKAKSNEAFKNNMEGHMSGVVQWVYQVNLNPEQLKDQYVKDHCSELFQTAERLKTFFDYYHRMGNEKWERGFLNDGVTVGVRGKEILDIKEEQAKNFLELLSNQFKTVLSVDIDTGEFLTDDNRTAFAANLSAREQTKKKTELESACDSEEGYYQQMVARDLSEELLIRDLAKENPAQKKVFDEHEEIEKRYNQLSEMFNSGSQELEKCGELTKSIRAQMEKDQKSFNRVYVDMEKCLQLNYANQTVLGKKLQGIVNQKREELQTEIDKLKVSLNSYEEPIRFIVKGGKIGHNDTMDTLVKSGYPVDDLAIKYYRSTGGIVDQFKEDINTDKRLLFGRSEPGAILLRAEAKSLVGYDLKDKYAPDMRSFMDENENLENTSQATLDYVNFVSEKKMYENDDVMRYFTRLKELVGDAEVFKVIKDGKEDEKATNRRFTAFLLQDFANRYTSVFALVLKENEDPDQIGPRFKQFTAVAASLQKIAAYDTTGKNYNNDETMQRALNTYREMADRVASEIDKRIKEKKTAQ